MEELRRFIRAVVQVWKESSPCPACMLLRVSDEVCAVYCIDRRDLAKSLKAHREAGTHEG